MGYEVEKQVREDEAEAKSIEIFPSLLTTV
jgi:hypothetical protein